ncbi:hypothetical protein HJB88_22555 [Rhizobium sp. NZLR5]|uniref:hypothetical protein n=1 Tax=unclassified Rhizobium TaxID=2613769 RepID=UPI001C82AABF|nr:MULTISPECIES: hypothetical protein [unclassified Rhizobium]MBX5161185.1 hypothetical protein [Rhizobium sp. NZLR8]MBX5185391.1 hypothetical protein [Rhizobium sp. NZLR5]
MAIAKNSNTLLVIIPLPPRPMTATLDIFRVKIAALLSQTLLHCRPVLFADILRLRNAGT